MKKLKEESSLKDLLKYLPIILLFPIALNFVLFSFDSGLSYGDGNVWLSFWGNYSGGVISAIVAYLVANTQIKKQAKIEREQKKQDRIIAQLPSLVRIKFELVKYLEQLINVKEERDYIIQANGGLIVTSDEKGLIDYDESEDGIEDFVITGMKFRIELLDKEIYNLIEKIEDDDLHIDLITNFKIYESISDALSYDIDKFKKEEERLKTLVVEGVVPFSELHEAVMENGKESGDYFFKKEKAWKQFLNSNIVNSFETLLARVESEIGNVKREKEN